VEFFRSNYEKNWFFQINGSTWSCHVSEQSRLLFDFDKPETSQEYPTHKGNTTGGPFTPILIHFLCKGIESHLLHKAEQERHIKNLAITRGGLKINHLFFADDSVFQKRNFSHLGLRAIHHLCGGVYGEQNI
jgi:hypothetical protein